MARYDDLSPQKSSGGVLSFLKPVSPERIAALRRDATGLPSDYLDFLVEIGAGPLGRDQYMLYDGLIPAEEIFRADDRLSSVAMIGDDLGGVGHGFDRRSWRLVEIDGASGPSRTAAPSFDLFIRSLISEIS